MPAGRLVENAPGVDGRLTDDALLHPPPHRHADHPQHLLRPLHLTLLHPVRLASPPAVVKPDSMEGKCFPCVSFFQPVLRAWSPVQVNVGFHSQLIQPDKKPFQVVQSSQGVGVVQDWFGKWLPRSNLAVEMAKQPGPITNCQVQYPTCQVQ